MFATYGFCSQPPIGDSAPAQSLVGKGKEELFIFSFFSLGRNIVTSQ